MKYWVYFEYVQLIIILWNYPPFFTWNVLHSVYFGISLISSWMSVMYKSRVDLFIGEENVLENYESVLIFHVYKTLAQSLYYYISTVIVYFSHHNKNNTEIELLIVCGCIHLIMNYLYYFGELQHENALFVRSFPHMIDIFIIVSRIHNILLRLSIISIHMFGFIVRDPYFNKLISCIETYFICKILDT